jgi:ceramide glucosyltransferase
VIVAGLGALWWTALVITAAALCYLLLALVAVGVHRPRYGPGWEAPPRVTLLKPLCGIEDELEEALVSFFNQQTSFPVRFVFGVTDPADPAMALCRQVVARFPRCDAEFVVDASIHSPNPKVSNLINMARSGLDEVVVISDSDIVIGPGTLQAAIDALAAPGVGAVTTLYRARPGIAGDRVRSFGAWYLTYWDLPMQVLYARLVPLAVTYGPLTAVHRKVLESIGGLAALADHLCDDAALGRLVHDAGYSVAFTPAVAETLINDASFGDLFRHELRWARTVRGLEPLGYVASVVTHPGPIPLLLLLRPGWLAVAAIMLPIALRWLLARLVMRRFGRAKGLAAPGPLALWLRDCACFAIWTAGLVVAQVNWRGQRLALHRGDILEPAASVPQRN